jgi:hypothetical protein
MTHRLQAGRDSARAAWFEAMVCTANNRAPLETDEAVGGARTDPDQRGRLPPRTSRPPTATHAAAAYRHARRRVTMARASADRRRPRRICPIQPVQWKEFELTFEPHSD